MVGGDLLAALPAPMPPLPEGVALLRRFAEPAGLAGEIAALLALAPLRQMETPGGRLMSVAMSSCGACGWVSDRRGYRYADRDPLSGAPWPAMPRAFAGLAEAAAEAAGFAGFAPDSCLINRYAPGARMALHQDRNERDMRQPIVSVSLGLPARFLFGGARREDAAQRLWLGSGDVGVGGGPARLFFHGVAPLAGGEDALFGACRFNLTFRRAR